MATAGPPPGQFFSPQQIQQMIALEAQKRGMTVEQFQASQRQAAEAEAAKLGMSLPEYVQMKQEEARQQFIKQQQQQQQQQQGGQQAQQGQAAQPQPQPQRQVQQIPVNANVEPTPEALAVAKFLRAQNLKSRTCILNGQRKDMFKVKRAFRALNSDAYQKARSKNPVLPQVTNDLEARQALQLLPLSMLALRVTKKDPHEGHDHPKPKKEKRVKGLWDVKVEQQQDFDPMMHYVWLYEGSQWKTKVWGGLALIAVFAVVLFPLWPLMLRQGVWYLSVGMLGLLGLFFAMAIFRLILFCATVFTVPPGLWLFPNLFEDVGFFDSFKPVWGWQETTKKKAKKTKNTGAGASITSKAENAVPVTSSSADPTSNGTAVSSGAETVPQAAIATTKRHAAPTVEEADDE